MMKEIVVVSGKGGTGKTLVCASFAALAGNAILVDADVEAPNLRLVVGAGRILEEHTHSDSEVARVDTSLCKGCGKCAEVCRFGAVALNGVAVVDDLSCEGCAACFYTCPEKAIVMEPRINGRWWVAECRYGLIFHGRLEVGEGLSGKLVAVLKERARKQSGNYRLRIVDGPPGIGCPVLAALTGADFVVVVTEPTLSGLHDAERVVGVAQHFGLKVGVCVNKADLNPDMTAKLHNWVAQKRLVWLGELPFDETAYSAMANGTSPVELGGRLAAALQSLYRTVTQHI